MRARGRDQRRRRWASRLARERGDVILHGLAKMLAGLLVLGLIVFEVGAVAVNIVQLDDLGRRAALSAAVALRDQGSVRAAEDAARRVVAEHAGAQLEGLSASGESVTVTVSSEAEVLLVDRIPPLRPHLHATATKTATPGQF